MKVTHFILSFAVVKLTSSDFIGRTSCPFRNIQSSVDTYEACGTRVSACPETKYRSYDGSCNNLQFPSRGTPYTTYKRLLPNTYADGMSEPTISKSGNELPNARNISRNLFPYVDLNNPLRTLISMQYGQFLSHDLSALIDRIDPIIDGLQCCSAAGQILASPPQHCYSITVPEDDLPFISQNITCLPFSRSVTDKDKNCAGRNSSAAVEQLTDVNHYLDLSVVYGSDADRNYQLRSFEGGELATEMVNQDEMLPYRWDEFCDLRNESCYLTGDHRGNQNPQLAVLQTIFVREHNRIARELTKINPHWNDEILFQEARKINSAQHQHIAFYEWLPLIIGREQALQSGLIYETTDFVADYNPDVDITVYNEFSTAALRFLHTLIAGKLDIVTEPRTVSGFTMLGDHTQRPEGILSTSFDGLARGLCTQPAARADIYHDKEITQNWLRKPQGSIGQDLKAIDIQRSRDHALASYNDHRVLCGLPKAQTFDDFLDVMNQSNVDKLATLYEDPDDVELTAAGALENILENASVGFTFQCIITKQFYKTRVGDRFWFENPCPTGFTLDQLNEIRKSKISKVVCENTPAIERIQPRGFEQISAENNLVPCASLPTVNLNLWRENPPKCLKHKSTHSNTHKTFEI